MKLLKRMFGLGFSRNLGRAPTYHLGDANPGCPLPTKPVDREEIEKWLKGELERIGVKIVNKVETIESLRAENQALRELVKWAIEYVDMGADGAINTDFENDFLARAKALLEGK